MHGVFVDARACPAGPAACAVGRRVAEKAGSLRDAVRAANLPLPIAAVAATACSLVIVITGRRAP